MRALILLLSMMAVVLPLGSAVAQDQGCRVTKGVRFILDFTMVSKAKPGGAALSDALLDLVNKDCAQAKLIVEHWWAETMTACKPEYDAAIRQKIADGAQVPASDGDQFLERIHDELKPCRQGYLLANFDLIRRSIMVGG